MEGGASGAFPGLGQLTLALSLPEKRRETGVLPDKELSDEI